jgi:cytochrome P450
MNLKSLSLAPRLSGGHGLLGHARDVERDRLAFVAKVTRETERVSTLRVPSVSAIVINHPELLHEVMVERARDFEKSHLLRYSLYLLAGEGLFTALFEPWKRHRRMISPAFHPASLGVFADPMVECARKVVTEWDGRPEIDLLRETTRITMAIAGRTLFDADTLKASDEIGHALTVALEWAANNAPSTRSFVHLWVRQLSQATAERMHAPSGSFLRALESKLTGPVLLLGREGRQLRHAIDILDRHVATIIAERRANSSAAHAPEDLLSRILAARDDDDGSLLHDRQIRDEILTLFVAGHETTATALAWCIDLLTRNPVEYRRVQAEVDLLPHTPTCADLPKLGATLRAFKEALRLYPPVYLFSRQACRETQIDGYQIPRNCSVAISPHALHRRSDLWPSPDSFQPERFTKEQEDQL